MLGWAGGLGVGSKNVQSQDLLEAHAFVGAIDTDVRVELKEDGGLQKTTPTVEAVAASLMQGAMAQFLAKMNEVLSLDMAVPSNEQADKADSPAPAEGNQGSALAPLPAEGKDNSVLALGKQDSVLALPGAASADAIRLRGLPREYLSPSMQQLHGLYKRDSAEAEAGSVCLRWPAWRPCSRTKRCPRTRKRSSCSWQQGGRLSAPSRPRR